MSPDLIWLCFTLAACLLLAWAWYGACREDDRRWQQTAADAARAVADDVAELRRQREIAELEAWLHARPRPRNTIPQQTRRTEDNQ